MTPRAASPTRAALACAALLAALALAPRPAAAAERCGACHPSERVQFASSRHASEGVGCVSCHGGNPNAIDAASAHAGGFRGKPSKREVPPLCASCHASESRMRAYNLPVDQYALYQTSVHGQKLAAGDLRVAVCSDCHGAHDILPPEDPASRVYVSNIPRTCGKCHGDEKLMGKGDKHGGVYAAYLSSAHAKALIERGNLRAPTCVSCHGVHGAAPPAVGDVGKVCGQCHTAERRYFAAGPHQRKLAEKGLPECASCHDHHAIAAAAPARLDTQCAKCHGDGSAQQKMGKDMLAQYQAAAKSLESAAAIIARADQVPIPTEDYKARLEEGRTYLSEALPSAHSVAPAIVTPYTSRALAVGHEIEHEIGEKLGEGRWHIVGLVLFWFYLLLTILVLRRFQERGAVRS